MSHHQITSEERYMIALLLWQGFNYAQIGRLTDRHRSTIMREVKRNLCNDGDYRAEKADSRTRRRRRESRQSWDFAQWQLQLVAALVRLDWSPEQISGWLKRWRIFSISHETIYRLVWSDRAHGGTLFKHLRQAGKQRRKRYRSVDSRGVMPGKRHISERPASADNRSRFGHWEGDTVLGAYSEPHCVATLLERRSGFVSIGKLNSRTTAELNRACTKIIRAQPRPVLTITADNGTEFHQFRGIEKRTGVQFFFSTPHHPWERGANENVNGLIRQYLPKGKSMAGLSQDECDHIAYKLNTRPRKRLGFKSPEEVYAHR